MKKYIKILLFSLPILLIVIFTSISFVNNTNIKLLHGAESSVTWVESDSLDLEDIFTFDIGNDNIDILLLSDIQIGTKNGYEVFDLIDELVEENKPDLILTLGDNTSGPLSHVYAKELIKHMEQYGIPWAVTIGNHDSEGIADRRWFGNAYDESEHSLFQMGPNTIEGTGNFVINIESNKDHVYSLIMMDSNGLTKYDDGRDYDVIHEDQILWYEWLMRELPIAYGTSVESMLFFHIPIPEFEEAKEEFLNYNGDDPTIFGVAKESVFSPPVNSGLFNSILEYNSTTHIFVGHDHVNSFSYPYQGIQFTYGLKTGYNSYHDKDNNGATLLSISKDGVSIKHLYK